jgi:hypothetical protein
MSVLPEIIHSIKKITTIRGAVPWHCAGSFVFSKGQRFQNESVFGWLSLQNYHLIEVLRLKSLQDCLLLHGVRVCA